MKKIHVFFSVSKWVKLVLNIYLTPGLQTQQPFWQIELYNLDTLNMNYKSHLLFKLLPIMFDGWCISVWYLEFLIETRDNLYGFRYKVKITSNSE